MGAKWQTDQPSKIKAVILIVDIIMGLLLFGVYCGQRMTEREALSVTLVKEEAENERSVRMAGKEAVIAKLAKEEAESKRSVRMAGKEAVIAKLVKEEAENERSVRMAEEKKIALTFDDGPHPYYTEQLLDGLKEKKVVATFFVTGEHASLHPEIISRMQAEGHLIGNHTYSHIQLTAQNREAFKQELLETNEILESITGEEVQYVRPPYGTWDKSLEAEVNMFPVLWTIDPLDWCSHNAQCVASKILEKAEEYDIILLHDYYETSVTAALQVVEALQEQGYTFVTVDEILFE